MSSCCCSVWLRDAARCGCTCCSVWWLNIFSCSSGATPTHPAAAANRQASMGVILSSVFCLVHVRGYKLPLVPELCAQNKTSARSAEPSSEHLQAAARRLLVGVGKPGSSERVRVDLKGHSCTSRLPHCCTYAILYCYTTTLLDYRALLVEVELAR